MSANHCAFYRLLAVALSLFGPVWSSETEAKTSAQAVTKRHQTTIKAHKTVAARRSNRKLAYGGKHWFVPPPPPYTPTMLPELQYSQMTTSPPKVEAAEDDNPYSKYIYTRSGYDAPRRVQPNKYVTVWTNKT